MSRGKRRSERVVIVDIIILFITLGDLCSQCKEGYGVSLDIRRCVKDNTCGAVGVIIFVFTCELVLCMESHATSLKFHVLSGKNPTRNLFRSPAVQSLARLVLVTAYAYNYKMAFLGNRLAA